MTGVFPGLPPAVRLRSIVHHPLLPGDAQEMPAGFFLKVPTGANGDYHLRTVLQTVVLFFTDLAAFGVPEVKEFFAFS